MRGRHYRRRVPAQPAVMLGTPRPIGFSIQGCVWPHRVTPDQLGIHVPATKPRRGPGSELEELRGHTSPQSVASDRGGEVGGVGTRTQGAEVGS